MAIMAKLLSKTHHVALAVVLVVVIFMVLLGASFGVSSGSFGYSDEVTPVLGHDYEKSDADYELGNIIYAGNLLSREDKPVTVEPASDDVYKKATEKGKHLMCLMKDPSAAGSPGKSKWNDFDQLKEWGWKENTGMNYMGEKAPGIVGLLGDGYETTNIDKTVRFSHDGQHADQQVTGPDGKKLTVKYPPTNAQYVNNLYPEKGVIVAESNWSPKAKIDDDQTPLRGKWDKKTMRQPELFQMSDIWWLIWKQYTTPQQRKKLRHIAKHNIVNDQTVQVMARALKEQWPNEDLPQKGKAPKWKGKEFTPDMPGFAPMLGTTSIWGIPYLLIQHHGDDELGHLEVKKITVFDEQIRPQSFYQPNVIVEIGPVSGGK